MADDIEEPLHPFIRQAQRRLPLNCRVALAPELLLLDKEDHRPQQREREEPETDQDREAERGQAWLRHQRVDNDHGARPEGSDARQDKLGAVPEVAPAQAPDWTHKTLINLLRDPRYWGEARDALLDSKYQDEQPPVALPSYVRPGEAYVTPEEARRVHAMLRWTDEHAGRPPKREWGLLLTGGIAICGYCGKRLDPHDSRIPRADSALSSQNYYFYYKCSIRRDHGPDPAKGGCPGVSINADVLDYAAIATLDEQVAHGDFLRKLFAVWERNEGAAADAVRIAKEALDEAEANSTNLAEWAMRTPPDSVAGAALATKLDEINRLLPGLRKRYAQAQADVEAVRANAALAQELQVWFAAWIGGFWDLPLGWQRRFLTSINAQVAVWREDDPARIAPDGTRLPRAELRIGLPTDASVLPRYPMDVVTAAAKLAEKRAFQREGFEVETPEERAAREQMWHNMTADEVMERVRAEMATQGLRPPKAASLTSPTPTSSSPTTSKRRSKSTSLAASACCAASTRASRPAG